MSKNCTNVRAADYFSSFNQSDHCFLASSLPSSLLKHPHDYDRQHQDKSRLFKIIICATITIYGLFLFEFQNVGEGNIGIKDLLLYANVIINPTKNEIISRFCFVFIL